MERCYWCEEELETKSHRRFIEKITVKKIIKGKEKIKDKYIYGHFCDDLCEYCFIYNKRIEKPNYVRAELGAYNHGREIIKQCETCGLEKETKEFPCKFMKKDQETNKNRRCYFCSERCLREFLD